jgi:hypothetical protein
VAVHGKKGIKGFLLGITVYQLMDEESTGLTSIPLGINSSWARNPPDELLLSLEINYTDADSGRQYQNAEKNPSNICSSRISKSKCSATAGVIFSKFCEKINLIRPYNALYICKMK